jgi:transcriptional regulator with XRE-family HTH domain
MLNCKNIVKLGEKMNFIGNIIEKYRNLYNMSRKELSEGICSEKYIYLIEKNKRTPSANMIKLLGDKMGVDLFSYYEYLDCINPLEVSEYMKQFKMYRTKLEPQLLYKSTIEAMKSEDFQNKPWIYEIKLNKLFYNIFVKNGYEESLILINKMLKEIEIKYLKSIYVANLYVLQSTCYIFLGDPLNAREATLSSYEIIKNKYKIKGYERIITTVRINVMSVYYQLGEYDSVINEGNDFLKYKHETDSYERIHFIYFYLAFAHYKLKSYEKSIEIFMKGIYLTICDDRSEDVHYILTEDIFFDLINDDRINKNVVNEFKKKYNIIK